MLNEDAVTDKDKVYRIEDNSDIISVRVQARRSILEIRESDTSLTPTAARCRVPSSLLRNILSERGR